MSTNNLCFEQKYEKKKKKSDFFIRNFHFLVLKFSVYLNRHVFIMLNFHEIKIISMCTSHFEHTKVISVGTS